MDSTSFLGYYHKRPLTIEVHHTGFTLLVSDDAPIDREEITKGLADEESIPDQSFTPFINNLLFQSAKLTHALYPLIYHREDLVYRLQTI